LQPEQEETKQTDFAPLQLQLSSSRISSTWDDSLVFAIRNSTDYLSLADWLESRQSVGSTKGDYHTWPEQWAIDSVQRAQKAYRNIEFGAAIIDERRLRITIRLPSS
jgi:hypothetical protein